ncbi:hypothetical protein [Fodinicurvata sp. EGI_FJ10296]|uniref:hypothetical protein n=1 Tax=Fodinicurvata sp. EGI_FJ10296 TaxID=3231908 RepID=UPI0034512F70
MSHVENQISDLNSDEIAEVDGGVVCGGVCVGGIIAGGIFLGGVAVGLAQSYKENN